MENNEHNLYKYSEIDLVNFIKEKNRENNNNLSDAESKRKNEFLLEVAMILEKKLKHNISLHQNGFKIYKQKLLADKTFIQNSIKKEIRSLTINQLIEQLANVKNESNIENSNYCFKLGKNKNNENKIENEIDIINQNIIKSLNNILSNNNENKIINNQNSININNINIANNAQFMNLNNQNNAINELNINNIGKNHRNKLIHGLNPKDVYHSPSPLILKKHQSKIVEENQNVNNQINFDEDQKIYDN